MTGFKRISQWLDITEDDDNATEEQVHKRIVDGLRHLGHLPLHIPMGGSSASHRYRSKRLGAISGTPDLVVCHPSGRTYWVEVKAKNGRVSAHQREMIEMLEEYGQPVCIARSWQDVEEFLVLNEMM